MDKIVISASNLTKIFWGKEVIRNCTFSVERGSIYGFLGRNGAGKTTVLKLLLGLLKPSTGTASVLGLDSVRDNEAILRRTGSLIETPIFYEHLSAADNLRLHLAYMGIEDTDVEPMLCRVGLPGTGSQPVSAFSLGMRQRLAIARAIIHRPEVLILDEGNAYFVSPLGAGGRNDHSDVQSPSVGNRADRGSCGCHCGWNCGAGSRDGRYPQTTSFRYGGLFYFTYPGRY